MSNRYGEGHWGAIPAYSGLFRLIPAYSGLFRHAFHRSNAKKRSLCPVFKEYWVTGA